MSAFAAVGVIVSDIERAADFYRKLGVAFPIPADADGHGHTEAQLPGGLRFMLDTEETISSIDPNWSRGQGGHSIGLAFECASPTDVNDTYTRMLGEGGTSYKEPWDAFWGQRYAQIKDPDGNILDLFAPLS